jgi:uncharacterized protein
MEYNFEWDPLKARRNILKHRVGFVEAAGVFKDAQAISIFDEDHSEQEERWITIGLDKSGQLIVVNHAYVLEENNKAAYVRIISARRATRKEQKQYYQR